MANAIINVGQTGGQINISTATAPATPAAGVVTLYAGTDKALHFINSDGADVNLSNGGPTGAAGATGATGAAGATGAGASSPITVEQTNSLVSTAIGATATACASVVVGLNTSSTGCQTVAIGSSTCTTGQQAVAIGNTACSSQFSVAIGQNTRATAELVVALGYQAISSADRAIAIGYASSNSGSCGMAIGTGTNNSGCASVSIGSGSNTVNGANSIGLGNANCVQPDCSVAIGKSNRIFPGATGTIVLGASSVGGTAACNSVVLGNSSQALTSTSIVIGQGAKDKSTTGGTLVGAIVIGRNACICAGNAYNGHIVIGNNACGYEQNSVVVIGDGAIGENIGVAIGCQAQAGTASIALGGQAVASGLFAFSVGRFARAIAQESMGIGYDSCGCCTKSISIGSSSRATHVCAVALGPGITTEKANTVHVDNLIAYGQAASKAHTVGSTGGSVTVDFDNSNVQTITLTSNITTLTKSNPIDGGVYTLFLTQGGTGGKTVSFGADVFFAGGAAPTLSTAAGATDAVSLVYVAGVTGYYGNANLNFA